MWGNFSDLAKKAQELQEQAAHSMATPTVPTSFSTSGFFNMDALQQEEEHEEKRVPHKQTMTQYAQHMMEASNATGSTVSPSVPLATPTVIHKKLASPKLASPTKGKLVVPAASKPASTATNRTPPSAPPVVAKLTASSSDGSGFFDDDEPPAKTTTPNAPAAAVPPSPAPTTDLLSAPSPAPVSPVPVNVSSSAPTALPAAIDLLSGIASTATDLLSQPVIDIPVKPPESIESTEEAIAPTLEPDQDKEASPEPDSHEPDSNVATQPSEAPNKTEVVEQSTDEVSSNGPVSATFVSTDGAEEPTAEIAYSERSPGSASDHMDAPKPASMDHDDDKNGTFSDSPDHPFPTTPSTEPQKIFPETQLQIEIAEPPVPVTDWQSPSSNAGAPMVASASDRGFDRGTPLATAGEDSASMEPEVHQSQDPSQAPQDVISTAAASQAASELQDRFSEQLQRLEANHQLETQQLQQQYTQDMVHWERRFHDLEQKYKREKIDRKRIEEGLGSKLEALQKELETKQELLEAKEETEKQIQESHLQSLRGMERQIFKKEDETKEHETKVKDLEQSNEESKAALAAAKEEYKQLKERSKQVATELKARRADCRALESEVDILKGTNNGLLDQITHLEAQGMDMNRSTKETQDELNSLRAQLIDQENALKEARASIATETGKGDEALAAYKRKAQQSLSVANARTASAVQAKEEAEMEARAARRTADSAMERAVAAELQSKGALAEAKVYVTEMEKQVSRFTEVENELGETKTKLERAQFDAESAQSENGKLSCEVTTLKGQVEAEQKAVQDLRKEISDAEQQSTEWMEEVERFRRDNQRLRDELQSEKDGHNSSNDKHSASSSLDHDIQLPVQRTAEAEATIAMLQQELRDANKAIKGLKETLKITVEDYEEQIQNQEKDGTSNGGTHSLAAASPAPDAGMPLFYAMEKQAELTQARNEITRLANLLGDAETSKQEAIDDMEGLREELASAHSQLQRQMQLGGGNTTPNKRTPTSSADTAASSLNVNVEYLKNVVWSFVNAKNLQEKKQLLPVIGTVLCWTPHEQKQAMQVLEESGRLPLGAIDSVASSVLGKFQW